MLKLAAVIEDLLEHVAAAAPVIFDGRNLYDPDLLSTFGITYYAIGRSNASATDEPMFGRRKTDRLESEAGS